MEKVEDSNEVHVIKKLWQEAKTMKLTDWMCESDVIIFFSFVLKLYLCDVFINFSFKF